MLTRNHTVLPVSHRFIHKWNQPYMPLLHSRRASLHFWLVLISCPTEGRRLSCPGWLGEILRWFARQRWSPVSVLTGPDRVTSLIRPMPLLLLHAATTAEHLLLCVVCLSFSMINWYLHRVSEMIIACYNNCVSYMRSLFVKPAWMKLLLIGLCPQKWMFGNNWGGFFCTLHSLPVSLLTVNSIRPLNGTQISDAAEVNYSLPIMLSWFLFKFS